MECAAHEVSLEGRVHHSDLQVAQNLVFSDEEVTCATAYVFERSAMRRATACCGS
jgi:hypothetical protein